MVQSIFCFAEQFLRIIFENQNPFCDLRLVEELQRTCLVIDNFQTVCEFPTGFRYQSEDHKSVKGKTKTQEIHVRFLFFSKNIDRA